MRGVNRILGVRSKTLRLIREFFHERGFLEVETPVRIPAPALEAHIDAEPAGEAYLRTSPELHMKRLLAAGCRNIFQIGPCFRRGEKGPLHHPEYTMLEWYRTPADYLDVLVDAKALLVHLAREICGTTDLPYRGGSVALWPVWDVVKVRDAYRRHAGWDPVERFDAERFDLDWVDKVEPHLPRDRPVVVMDYPAEAAGFAGTKKDEPRVAERWELFVGGLELANAYSELTDPAEQRARFEEAARRRAALGKPSYPFDEAFLAALKDMPPTGGVALGVDRLLMLLTHSASLDDVMPFRAG